MAYVDAALVNAFITSDVRAALLGDDDLDSTHFAQLVTMADAFVDAQLSQAGYQTGLTSPPEIVRLAALEVFLRLAHGRMGLSVPSGLADAIAIAAATAGSAQGTSIAEAIGSGAVPVSSLSASTRSGVGGFAFSESSSTIAGARRPIFSTSWSRFNRNGM